MVDFVLMARLVDAIGPTTRLILLGDRNQLASVDAGTVMADICGAAKTGDLRLSAPTRAALEDCGAVPRDATAEVGAPGLGDAVVHLADSRRFARHSPIGGFAEACLAETFDASRAVDKLVVAWPYPTRILAPGDGRSVPPAVAQTWFDGYAPYLRVLLAPADDEQAQHRAALDAFDTFRVLCAHREGPLGVAGVNAALTDHLGRTGVSLGPGQALRRLPTDDAFWVGRPILVLRNDPQVGLFNGDIGLVVTRAGRHLVAFPGTSAEQPVRLIPPSRLPDHTTCFALTIHKSQGSEFDHVVVVLPARRSPIVTRELLYTGITRAKRQLTIVGTRPALEDALQRTVQRASGLGAALWGGEG